MTHPDSAAYERVSDERLAEYMINSAIFVLTPDEVFSMAIELQERRALDKKETGR